ncbi:MAG: VWA domain-containing protein [Waddliaceae bacterium]
MAINQFHFAHPLWLWAAAVIPLAWLLFLLYHQEFRPARRLEAFIDKHLLPYLLINREGGKSSLLSALVLWSGVWASLTLAIAGPRWDFHEIETFSRDQSLMIVLDLSKSMDAQDSKPSRLVQARRKIEDLINAAKGVKIGLIAFAADPHMIAPLTDDVETIRHLLPSLDTDLVYLQGSRLSPALKMAANVFDGEPGENKCLLVISDGGFEDASAMTTAKELAKKGVVIHSLGVGTLEGAPVPDRKGGFMKKEGELLISKLDKEKMREISNVGRGRYFETLPNDHAETIILDELATRAEAKEEIGQTTRFWEEHFYLLIIPVLPVMLAWFRRGNLFAILLMICLAPAFPLEALEIGEYFKNDAKKGKEAFEAEEYGTAIEKFQDPYRKGVARYRAGNFADAEASFRQSSRSAVAPHAAYNLGNALVQQQKLEEAVTAYEDVIARWPDHQKAKDNLEIVKKMLKKKNQEKKRRDQKRQEQKNNKQQDQEQKNKQPKSGKQEDQEKQENRQQEREGKSGKQQDQEQKKGKQEDQEKQENRGQDTLKDQEEKEGSNSSRQHDQSEGGQQAENDFSPQRPEQRESTAPDNGSLTGFGDHREGKASKSREDLDADQWLNRIADDPKDFLKNKFYVESKRKGTKKGIDPW